MTEAMIDDEMIAAMKAREGVHLRIDHSVNNEEATRIAVTKFVGGIGDINPLWSDPDRAVASDFGAPVAPPSFVIGCFSGIQFGWPGLGAFHSATQMQVLSPVYWGDKIVATCRYDGFTGPRPSTFAGRMVTDHFTNTYTNQRDEMVAVINWQVVNYERAAARSRGVSRDLAVPSPWTPTQLQEVEARVLAEHPRGEEPRWWDDVQIGDPVSALTKGPIGLTDEVAFIAGGGTPIPRLKAHAAALHDYAAHPAWSFRDPVTGAQEPIYAVHYNKAAANAMGVAFQYDVGFQRQCWQVQLLTHWMGDAGWVVSVQSQYRGFVYLSDVLELGGEVVGKFTEGDDHVVEVTTWARNQRGEDVMPGTAKIALPARTEAESPVTRRVRGVGT